MEDAQTPPPAPAATERAQIVALRDIDGVAPAGRVVSLAASRASALIDAGAARAASQADADLAIPYDTILEA